MAGTHVELREIDYAEVLRERRGGDAAAWEDIIASCLQGDASLDLDDETSKLLLEIAGDEAQLGDLFVELDARAAERIRAPARGPTPLIRLLEGIVRGRQESQPRGRRSRAPQHGRRARPAVPGDDGGAALARPTTRRATRAGVVDAVVNRMTEQTIASFVARNAIAEGSSLDRVAQAFHTLVRDRRSAPAAARRWRTTRPPQSPFGSTEGFEEVWNHVAEKLLTSYSDKPFVSDSYARELSGAQGQAIDDRTDQRRSARAHERLAGDGGDERAAPARSDARPRPAAHRGGRRRAGAR